MTDTADGCILPVRAQPGARRTGVVGMHNGALKVAVSVAPEQGKANEAIRAVLCDLLGLRRTQIELVSGASSRDKRFLVRGLNSTAVQPALSKLVDAPMHKTT